jgi:hypothetical protein
MRALTLSQALDTGSGRKTAEFKGRETDLRGVLSMRGAAHAAAIKGPEIFYEYRHKPDADGTGLAWKRVWQ